VSPPGSCLQIDSQYFSNEDHNMRCFGLETGHAYHFGRLSNNAVGALHVEVNQLIFGDFAAVVVELIIAHMNSP
jgi:hypothetical protein